MLGWAGVLTRPTGTTRATLAPFRRESFPDLITGAKVSPGAFGSLSSHVLIRFAAEDSCPVTVLVARATHQSRGIVLGAMLPRGHEVH